MLQKQALTLRIFWMLFASFLLLGEIGNIIAFSNWYLKAHWIHCLLVLFKTGLYGLLIANTWWHKPSLWLFAIAVISIKTFSLLDYYLVQSWTQDSTFYFQDYATVFFRIKLPRVGQFLFGNSIFNAVLMTAIYSYWLYLCEGMPGYSSTIPQTPDNRN